MWEKQMQPLSVSEDTRLRMEGIRRAHFYDWWSGGEINWKVEMQKEHVQGEMVEFCVELKFEVSFTGEGSAVTMTCD